LEKHFYIHVYDGWLEASSISGPWMQSFQQPLGMDSIARTLAESGAVDMLDGGAEASPRPSLANGVPTLFTSQVPAELIVFKGQPDFQAVVGTQFAVGREHYQRRADRHQQQPLLRADLGPLVCCPG